MSNIVTLNNIGQAVTTSLAIADGVGNSHATVIKLIRQNVNDLEEFGPIGFEIQKGQPLPQGGFAKPTEYAILNEQQSTLLLTYMRNNDVVREFKKRLVKAFFELAEQKPAPQFDPAKALNDPATMRSLLLGYTEKVLELEDQIKAIQPKADALDLIAADSQTITVTQGSKILSIKRDTLTNYLSTKKWTYRQNGSWVAYQSRIQSGDLVYKEAKYTDENTGQQGYRPYCHITQKGLAKLAEMLAKDGLIQGRAHE